MYERAFLGQVRLKGLGQAAINPGSSFQGPFGMYSDIGQPHGSNAPAGFPAMTPEIATPGGEATEKHCYQCSDGSVSFMTIDQARARGGCTPLSPSDPRCAAGGPAAPPGGYVSPLPGARVAAGPPPLMTGLFGNGPHLGQVRMRRSLGQAAINPGSSFQGPFGMYSDIGQPQGSNAPAGFPAMTPEIATPGGEATEKHCFQCSDGSIRFMTIDDARAMGGCSALSPSDPRCAAGGPAAPAGGYVSPLPGARYAAGPPPGLMGERRAFLGQVQLVSGPSTTPFYAYPPYSYIANPSGSPLMTEELTSPESSHIAREFHCYKAPDGSYVSIPFGAADSYKAAGYEATDYSNCKGLPPHAQPVGGGSFMGQAKGGGGGGGAPAANQGVAPMTVGPGPQTFSDAFAPQYIVPSYPAPQPGMTCKKRPDEDTYDCVPKQPTVQTYRYPTVFMTPLFY